MKETNLIKEKIQQAISKVVEKNNRQKELLSFLFGKLEEIKEYETLEWLKKRGDDQFLKAYLLYKSISKANYQPEHLKLIDFQDGEKYLKAIERDIDELEEKPKPSTPQLNNQQLLMMLGERIAAKEIKRDWQQNEYGDGGAYTLWIGEGENGELPSHHEWADKTKWSLQLDLRDGKITPDPAEEFLKKHGIEKEIEK